MRLNLAYIGALPWRGIMQVRVHWMLDLVKVTRMTQSGPVYDFANLDAFLSLLRINGLSPGFELMGNPSSVFTDMQNKTQVYWWRDLIYQTAKRCADKFGLEEVEQWNFETWNEPDNQDFDRLNMSIQGFLNYYDACSEGLLAVSNRLVLGGPGSNFAPKKVDGNYAPQHLPHPYSTALFNHSVHGVNFFTGQKGVRLDFVSFHEKGQGKAHKILDLEISAYNLMVQLYPELAGKPVYNDEGDPLVDWSEEQIWRATAVYAAQVVKVISQHQYTLRSRPSPPIPNFSLLSNDNGFLSYYPFQFTQRTLLARFQMNNSHPAYVTFIRKPVYATMALMSLLGEIQLGATITNSSGGKLPLTSDVGTMASLHEPRSSDGSDSLEMALLLYNAPDPHISALPSKVNISWTLEPDIPFTEPKLMVYSLSMSQANPYSYWDFVCNHTDFPSLTQFEGIRSCEDPHTELHNVTLDSQGHIQFPHVADLTQTSVLFYHLCAKPKSPPGKVIGLRALKVGQGQVLFVWDDILIQTRCIHYYELQQCTTFSASKCSTVNKLNSIVNLYLYETDSQVKVEGFYRVRAVDYWSRKGEFSDIIQYS